MTPRRDFLLFVTLATAAATPVMAQTATPAVDTAANAAHRPAAIPDFPASGIIRPFPGSSRRHWGRAP